MTVYTILTSPVATNTYLMDAGEGYGIAVDPGDGARVAAFAEKKGLKIQAVLLTHGHFDHAGGAAFLQKAGANIFIAVAEEALLTSDANLAKAFGTTFERFVPDRYVQDGETVALHGIRFRVLATPGHTSGSVCYLVEDSKIIFSGDTLFADSVGRTDFPTGNARQMLHSLQQILFRLEGDYTVYPGHGSATTLLYEKGHNPYADHH